MSLAVTFTTGVSPFGAQVVALCAFVTRHPGRHDRGHPALHVPEQSLANAAGPAADVCALAGVLREPRTGRPPFTPDDSRSRMWHLVHTPAAPIRTLRPDEPADIENLLPPMLTRESGQRWCRRRCPKGS